MPRNAEVIRQWTILSEIEHARGAGVTIDELASLCAVTTRTIRRDLQALEEAGFPLFDDKGRDDGRTRWSINGQAFKTLIAGLTLSELSALYFSRTLLESLAGTPFAGDLESAFDKLAAGLTPHMRNFLDQLPRVRGHQVRPDAPARAGHAGAVADRRACAGCHAPSPAGHLDLSLTVERAHQDVPDPSVPARLRAGRTVSAGVRSRIRRSPHLRARTD